MENNYFVFTTDFTHVPTPTQFFLMATLCMVVFLLNKTVQQQTHFWVT